MLDAPHQTPCKIVFGMEFVLTSSVKQIRKIKYTQNAPKNSAKKRKIFMLFNATLQSKDAYTALKIVTGTYAI